MSLSIICYMIYEVHRNLNIMESMYQLWDPWASSWFSSITCLSLLCSSTSILLNACQSVEFHHHYHQFIIMMALSHLCWVQLLEFCFAIPIWGDKQVGLGKSRSGSLRVSIGRSPKWVGQFQPAPDVGQSHSNCITHVNERKSKKEEGRGKSNWSHERRAAQMVENCLLWRRWSLL